jgi:hypothetical protein
MRIGIACATAALILVEGLRRLHGNRGSGVGADAPSPTTWEQQGDGCSIQDLYFELGLD